MGVITAPAEIPTSVFFFILSLPNSFIHERVRFAPSHERARVPEPTAPGRADIVLRRQSAASDHLRLADRRGAGNPILLPAASFGLRDRGLKRFETRCRWQSRRLSHWMIQWLRWKFPTRRMASGHRRYEPKHHFICFHRVVARTRERWGEGGGAMKFSSCALLKTGVEYGLP